MSLLDRATITAALTALNDRLAARGRRAEQLVAAGRGDRAHFQLHINDFVDEFRRATAPPRAAMVAAPPATRVPSRASRLPW